MAINNATSEPLTMFRPDDVVTRAEFGTMLSRLLFGSLYNIDAGDDWYVKHMSALESNNILTKNDPFMIEKRGYTMLMLERVSEILK